jgi:hypothetical protein
LAPATIEQLLRGDSAVDWNMGLASLSEAQRQEFFRSYLRKGFDFITLKSASFTFDKAKRELHVSFKGDAKLDWNGGNFHVANSTVGYDPDFERAEGPLRDAPFAVAYPEYTRTVTRLRLPASFLAGRELGSTSVQETLAGVEYGRSTTIEGDVLVIKTTARSLVPEIPYKDAIAAEKRLEALADEELALPLPRRYRPTDRDLVALAANKPASKSQFLQRGLTFLDAGKFDDAIAISLRSRMLIPRMSGRGPIAVSLMFGRKISVPLRRTCEQRKGWTPTIPSSFGRALFSRAKWRLRGSDGGLYEGAPD